MVERSIDCRMTRALELSAVSWSTLEAEHIGFCTAVHVFAGVLVGRTVVDLAVEEAIVSVIGHVVL